MEYTHRQLPQLLGPAVRSIEGMRRREAAHGGRWHPRLALVLLMLVLSLCRSGEAKQQHQQRQRRQCLSSLPSMSTARARRRLIGLRGGATAVPTTKAAGVVPVVGNEDEEALVEVRLLRRRPRVVLQLVLAALLGLGVLASLGRVPLLLLASTPIEAAAAEADGSSSTSAATSAASLPALLLLTLSAAANLLYWLVQRWSVAFKVWAGYRTANVPAEASSVLVLPRPHKGEPALLPLTREPAPAPAKGKKKKKAPAAATPAFVYQHRTYQLGRKGFQQRRPALHLPLAHYLREPGPFVGKGGEAKAAAARALYGPNALDVAVPPLKSLLVEEALTPVSVLKLLDLALAAADRCVVLWSWVLVWGV